MQILIISAVILLILALACYGMLRSKSRKSMPRQHLSYDDAEIAHTEPTEDTSGAVTHNKQLVEDLHRVLEEEKVFLRPDIHIDDVARMLLTNRTYVTRLMRQEYGLTFIEYINVARIQYSQKLLYSSGLSLDDIATKSGFQSTSNYCRTFKRYVGSSPMSWLQTVK